MFPQHNLEALVRLFYIQTKKELEVYCKTLEIHADDFANFVLAVKSGVLPYQHQLFSRQIEPEHLQPTDSDFVALTQANPGEALTGRAAKFSTKIQQLFKDRRFLVGHLFFTPDQRFWHFFYFDQRDRDQSDNHWVGGSHIHLLNYLWPGIMAKGVIEAFTSGKPKFPRSLHIRFNDGGQPPKSQDD